MLKAEKQTAGYSSIDIYFNGIGNNAYSRDVILDIIL